MIHRLRTALVASVAVSALGLLAAIVPSAQASVLSLLPGSCGQQAESQVFARWGDENEYTLVKGGDFEAGTPGWQLSRDAAVVNGNETFYVHAATDSHSLSLPSGSSAISAASCTSIYHPTVRMFVRNQGAPSSHLLVQALYPGLLGGVDTTTIGELSGTSSWEPSPAMPLLLDNLLATVSLDQTVIAFRFTPTTGSGSWSIDDVYLDPYCRG